ncbi:MAG: nucleoside-diphosphate kinase [Candidatus Absconditicoccaceae bacterium]
MIQITINKILYGLILLNKYNTVQTKIYMNEKILTIIKPDAMNHCSEIWTIILNAGFVIHKSKKIQFTHKQAEEFYFLHPHSKSFTEFMISGECMVAILEKNNAVKDFRKLIGDDNPAKAKPGTIRALFGNPKLYAKGIPANAIHGPESLRIAKLEIELIYS